MTVSLSPTQHSTLHQIFNLVRHKIVHEKEFWGVHLPPTTDIAYGSVDTRSTTINALESRGLIKITRTPAPPKTVVKRYKWGSHYRWDTIYGQHHISIAITQKGYSYLEEE